MSTLFEDAKQKLQYIDLKDKDVVFGFIHNAQNLFATDENPYYFIPELVIYLVLNFCYDTLFGLYFFSSRHPDQIILLLFLQHE